MLHNAQGIQLAGIANKTNNFTGGIQAAGMANVDKQAKGFLIAGVFNRAKTFNGGVQVAGLFNIAGQSKGLQFSSLFNSSANDAGSQFTAVFNRAKKVKGFQFALVNVADSSDHPIGLINFVKNGEKSLALSTDETLMTHLDFRSGGRVLYGLLGIGYQFDDTPAKYALDIGLGAHLINHTKFYLNGEYVAQIITDFKDKTYQTDSFKILPGYKLSKLVRLFAGPSLNIISADVNDNVKIHGWELSKSISSDNKLIAVNIGITGGLQLVW